MATKPTIVALSAWCALVASAAVWSQSAGDFDICGCIDHPESLGNFNSADPSTYPPGTVRSTSGCDHWVGIPLPEDGVLVFDSFVVATEASPCGTSTDVTVYFLKNPANSPVTLLVSGDMWLQSRGHISVAGSNGGQASSVINGIGGAPGPGGFRGGDGALLEVLGTGNGGDGLGAGGGAAGLGFQHGTDGSFGGNRELLPLTGGSGGGGGGSGGSGNCSGGGGGGGGGALLAAVNGRVTISARINADGGTAGGRSNSACSGNGGRGSGGAIRIVASEVTGGGTLLARGGASTAGKAGVIRIESFSDTFCLGCTQTYPAPIRTKAIAQLANPLGSAVTVVAVDDQNVPDPPTGSTGGIDLIVPAPGLVALSVNTVGVPGGTTVDVAVKPQIGGRAVHNEVTLAPTDCNSLGECSAVAAFELDAGAYFIEATATFRTPPGPT